MVLSPRLKIPYPEGLTRVSRATMVSWLDAIEANAATVDDNARPFAVQASAWDGPGNRIRVTLGPGRARVGDQLIDLVDPTIVDINAPAINTTYSIYLTDAGTFAVATGVLEVDGQARIHKVVTGNPASGFTVTDQRSELPGAPASGVVLSNNRYVQARSAGGTKYNLIGRNASDELVVGDASLAAATRFVKATGGYYAFDVNGSTKVRIDGTGLGIGMTPTYPLDVNGNARIAGVLTVNSPDNLQPTNIVSIYANNQTIGVGIGYQNIRLLGSGNADLQIDAKGTGVVRLGLNSTGGAAVTGGLAMTTGNLVFSATGSRITGDMTNASQANRLLFQTSTANGSTALGVIPNGSATIGQVNVYNTSDPSNPGFVRFRINGAAADITATGAGSGTVPTSLAFVGFTSGYSFDQAVTVSAGNIDALTGNIRARAGTALIAYSLAETKSVSLTHNGTDAVIATSGGGNISLSQALTVNATGSVFSAGADANSQVTIGSGGAAPTAGRTAFLVLNAPSSGGNLGNAEIFFQRDSSTGWIVGYDGATGGAKSATSDFFFHNGATYVAALSTAGTLRTAISSGVDNIQFKHTGGGVTYGFQSWTDSKLYLNLNGSTSLMVWDSSSNVGINGAPKAWSSPMKALDFSSGGGAVVENNRDVHVMANTYYDGSWRNTANAALSRYLQTAGVHYWYSDASPGAAGTAFTPTERMHLNTARLMISVPICLATDSTAAASTVDWSGTTLLWGIGSNWTEHRWYIGGNQKLSLDSSGNLIQGGGYYSIGASPAGAGTIRLANAGSIWFKLSGGADRLGLTMGSDDILQLGHAGSGKVRVHNSVVEFPSVSTTASAANAFLDYNGTSILNSILRSTSSLRYKHVEGDLPLEDAYRIVRGLRAIVYRSRSKADDPDRQFVGFGAEDVADLDRRFVTVDALGNPDWVQYPVLTAPLAMVAQDHDRRIAELERELAAVKAAKQKDEE